jgi:hypothetical protein
MNDFKKDIMIGLMFLSGIWSFISGEFVVSTVLFGSAAVYSNIAIRSSLNN